MGLLAFWISILVAVNCTISADVQIIPIRFIFGFNGGAKISGISID